MLLTHKIHSPITMNTLLNVTVPHQHQTVKVCSDYFGNINSNNKRDFLSLQPESLFSMAMYDMDTLSHQMQQHQHQLEKQQDLEALPAKVQFAFYLAFYPVEDENKDLSLGEILELSDDYLSGEEEENLFGEEEENNMINSTILHPIPFKVPCGQNVASMQMGNQTQPTMDHIEPTPINELRVPTMPSSCESPTKKRRREVPLDDESSHDSRLRPYQAGKWAEHFNDLCLYRQKHGNCQIPNTYRGDLSLARWVKRQRYQYKLMIEGKSSTMTEERVKALEDIGFVWDSQRAAWGERLEELKEFRSIYMHCNVPSNYQENSQLAIWVKCQRRQYRLLLEGKASNMTPQRIRDLEAVGFAWLLRSYRQQHTI
jgi:hypothetical protein